MRYILEIKRNKDKFMLEILKHFEYVKIQPLTKANIKFLKGIDTSIKQVKKAEAGKLKLKSARQILNEL